MYAVGLLLSIQGLPCGLAQGSGLYRNLTPEAKAWWSADVVHLIYSISAAVAAVCYLVASGGHALDLNWQAEAAGLKLAADAIVCVSAGFCAFFLWTLILQR